MTPLQAALISVTNMTTALCTAFSRLLPWLDTEQPAGQQVRAPGSGRGSWLPCSVFCRTATGSWYSPRTELAEFFLSATLPDGTPCQGTETGEQLYCQVQLRFG